MDTYFLKAKKRDVFGKKLEAFREKGLLPAVLYGPKDKNQSFFVTAGDFKKVWQNAGESGVVDLDIDGKKKQVLIYDVDMDPMRDEPRHVDFYVVDMTQKTTVSVPLFFEGESLAIKSLGGVLVKVVHELEVEALPANLPSELKVDISALKTFEDKITISDLKVSQDVKILADPEDAVALVEEPKEETGEESGASIEDIEVLSEKPSSAEEEESKGGVEKEKNEEKEEDK